MDMSVKMSYDTYRTYSNAIFFTPSSFFGKVFDILSVFTAIRFENRLRACLEVFIDLHLERRRFLERVKHYRSIANPVAVKPRHTL